MTNRIIKLIFSVSLLAAVGLATATFFSGSGRKADAAVPANASYTSRTTATAKETETHKPKREKSQSENAETRQENTSVIQYLSTQKEGIIGKYGEKQIDNPADNIFSIQLDNRPDINDKVWLSYELEGVADYTGIPYSINDRLATGGYLVKLADGKSTQRQQLNPAWLKKGENRIQFNLPEGEDYSYKVSNLSIEVEKRADASLLVVNSSGTSYNNKAYLHGFIQQKELAGTTVYVDGKEVKSRDGEFETIVPVGDSRKVNVKAVLATGKELTKEIIFTKGDIASIEYAPDNNIKQNAKTFSKKQAGELQLASAMLKVEANALLLPTKSVTVSTLRNIDLAALDMGMNNVTADYKGYRFLPHGEHFADGATVAIKYDRTKIPSGYTEDDIKTFYFDLGTKHWVALERDTIDKKNQLIVSNTTHFTDMINGVIQTPESPETQGFAPTMMNDIKAADPTAKVQVIAPPTANNRGSAGLSYSFEMPPARNGMQPSLGIQYNSDGGAGWLGEGWDLSTPSISVDTRWGVPRYSDNQETETYSFNGSMLMTTDDNGESSVAHRGDKINRKADRQFYPRNEGGFSKIIRKGSSPSNYTWEVTDKSGTKYIYGGNGGMLKGTAKTLNGDKQVAVEWKLSRVEELHGDWIEYTYESVDEPVNGGLTAKALYLTSVKAGNRGNEAHTVVTLTSNTQKDKKTNSARYGFLTSSNKLLDKVDIAFESETLRSYTFEYKAGAFNTNILSRINHIDSDKNVFAFHDMDYYDDVDSKNGYTPFSAAAETWNLPDKSLEAGFINPVSSLGASGFSDKPTALGGNKSTSNTVSAYVGVGIGFKPNKDLSAGLSYSHTKTTAEGLSTLIDINGDGLPDKVYKKGGSIYYTPNITKITDSEAKFGPEIAITGINDISKQTSRSNSWGPKAYVGIGIGKGSISASIGTDFNHQNNETSVYFADANNDGLIDLVVGSNVYFNHIEKDAAGNLVPTFTLSSGDTPSPIMGGGIIDDSDMQVDPQEQQDLIDNSPMQDVVRVWEAPFAGIVKIEGNVQLQAPETGYDAAEYAKADGVRVAIQVAGSEKWNKSIAKGDFASYPATINNVTVAQGQRVYFRVQSGTDEMSNGAFDKVNWLPVITYTDRTGYTDANGYATNVFKASEGNLMSMDIHNYVSPAASVKITSRFSKPVTSDNITLKAVLSNDSHIEDADGKGIPNPAYQEKIVYQKEFGWDEVHDGTLEFDITNNILGSNLQFFVLNESNVDSEQIKWVPVIKETENGSTSESNAIVKYSYFSGYLSTGQPYSLPQDAYLRITPLFPALSGLPSTSVNGEVLMTVKSATGLLAKEKIKIVNGIINPAVLVDSVEAKAGTVWVDYYFDDAGLQAVLGAPQASVSAYKDTFTDNKTVTSYSYISTQDARFGPMYRGWGQFVYNAAEGRYGNPIDESQLTLPEDENAEVNLLKLPLILMIPDRNNTCWIGQDPNSYIDGGYMSSSRLGEQDVILTNPLSELGGNGGVSGACLPGSGQVAISLKSKGDSRAVSGGVGGGIPVISGSGSLNTASGSETVETAYMDMNGDGYPDIITKNQIQLTNSRGGFDGEKINGNFTTYSQSSNTSVALGGTTQHAYSIDVSKININRVNKSVKSAEANVNATAGGDYNNNNSYTEYTLIDINGDGLPDKVLSDKKVQLNLGYGFTDPIDWGIDKIDDNNSYAVGLNAGVGGGLSALIGKNLWSGSLEAGFGINTVHSGSDYRLMDINNDGLPDKVYKSEDAVYVSFNTGNRFNAPVLWYGVPDLGKSASTSESLNAAFTLSIPIVPLTPISLKINPGYSGAKSLNRQTSDIRDVDGDGFPDIVSSDKESELNVKYSTIARTNKLKSVHNPLGGTFTLDYARSQATYDHPGGKWVMKSVEVNDGINDDGVNMKTVFDYQDGRQERHEREFLGFGKVITKNIDTEANEENKVYRQAIQQYDVANIYTAGNQIRSIVEDANGNKYTESVNEYYTYKVKASADNYTFTADNTFCTDRAIAFTPLKYTKSVVYEGQADGMTANESYYEYYLNGNYGDLENYKYSDKGTLGNTGTGAFNYQTSVEYAHNTGKHIFGLPVKVQVKGSDGVLYRQTEATYDMAYAHITKVSQTLDGQGAKAEIDITWDRDGNIKQKTLPANSKGQRMFYKYLYDRDYNMYVERVEDAFGYRSEMEDYDYRYGIPLTTRDMNGYTLETTIDRLGRVETITGPNEQVLGLPYTIKFEYHPQVIKDADSIKSPAYAVTKHYDPQNPNDDLETVTFVDGFGRAVQVKKDGVVTATTNGTNPQDQQVMIVSGRAKFDPFGRVREAFYPVSEAVGNKTVFNKTFDAVTPTKTEYDVMDRAVKTTLPDNSESVMEYTKDNGSRTLVTTVTDAMGGKQSTFSNGSGLTVKTEQYSGPDGTITTRFEFDPINQLLKAIDNGNNETISAYDMAGRRTQVIHPASGKTSFKYDNASNLLSKQTANLETEGKEITYEYDYSRLTAINYPDNPQNNVRYTYGNKNAAFNRVRRLMLQEDATGAQQFDYDRLGNIERVRRTVIIPNQAIATYVTRWKYDSWNRLEQMIYPDLEKVSYMYNTGGLLESVKGEKSYSYNYVNKLGYDKFEQRIYMKYCNGAETSYNYDERRRRLSNLMVISGKENRKQIMNNAYTYDKVDNVLNVINTAPLPGTGAMGGMSHTYNYDGLYRLKSATGTYTGADNKSAGYGLEMAYDNLHNIVSKKQHVQQQGVQFDGILKAGYDLAYTYNSEKPHQIANIQDDSYRTESDTIANDVIKRNHAYEYDANGNLVYVNTGREKQDGQAEDKAQEKKLRWDEENRLQSIYTNGFIAGYWYDASGERVIKTSGDDEGIYVNDVFSGGRTKTANFTAYINPYLVVSKGGSYTKHIYIGSQRIVSKLGDLDSYGQDPRRIEYAGSNVDGAKVDYKSKYIASQQAIKDNYANFEVPYYGTDNDDYVNGQGFCCNDTRSLKAGAIGNGNDNPELFQYYYHSDHLGSSSLITNLDGEVVQHVEYVPFGEVFIEERNNTWNTPYLFNAKELDEETGLYYYGARYYDPSTSLWLSTDPMQEKYPNVSTYAYCVQNPVNMIDPDGQDWIENIKTGELTWDKNMKSKEDFNKSNYNQELYSYAGKETQRAVSLGSTAGMYTIYYGPDGTESMYDYPNWMDRAKSQIGLTEGNNPIIKEMIDKLNFDFGYADKGTKPIYSDNDPWCGVFVYWALEGWDITSNSWQTPALNTFYSTNWKERTIIDKPAIGAIAVMSYNHVAIVVDYNDTYIWIVGGNQAVNGSAVRDGVEVNISKQKRSLVSKYVLPKSYNKPPLDTF